MIRSHRAFVFPLAGLLLTGTLFSYLGASSAPVAPAPAGTVSIADFGAVGGNPRTDDAPAIQAAIDAAVAREVPTVYCPPGAVYNLWTTVTLRDNVQIIGSDAQGYGGPTARFDAQVAGMTMFAAVGAHNVLVRGVSINGTNAAAIGIRLAQCASVTVRDCAIYNFGQDAAGIRGGGNQQVWIRDCRFNGYGFAVDLQNRYAADPHGSYYGANVFALERNAFSCNQGVRVSAIGKVDCNTFEHRVDGAASLQCIGRRDGADADSSRFIEVVNNQFDLQAGSGPLVGILYDSALGVVSGNTLYGAGSEFKGSIGIEAWTTYGVAITGNFVGRFERGIHTSGGYTANVLAVANTFKENGTDVAYPSRHYLGSPGYQTNPDFAGFLIHVPGQGHVFGGTFSCVPAECENTGPVLNLTRGRFVEFTNATPTKVTTVTGAVPGTDFYVTAKDGNTTLAGPAFGLAKDLTLPPNRPLHFVVGTDRQVREIVHSSSF